MCGRYTLVAPERIAVTFAPDEIRVDVGRPRYNVAPGQTVPVVFRTNGGRTLAGARWGLVPSWARDPDVGSRMINARAETVAGKPAFRAAFRHRRCLVPADGFYEWKRLAAGKQPMYVRVDRGAMFAFAGLYERWGPEPDPLLSCAIVTTAPNGLMETIHDRMPVILPAASWDEWLDPHAADAARLRSFLRPFDASRMDAYAVSAFVNSPAHDDEGCVAPFGATEDSGRQGGGWRASGGGMRR